MNGGTQGIQGAASTPPPLPLRLMTDASERAVHAAATLWADATNRRDAPASRATAQDKISGIQAALDCALSILLLARRGQHDVAFAVLVDDVDDDDLELLYLAVDPLEWGTGVAAQVLGQVQDLARQRDVAVTLWVIADNERAISVYRRAGWTATGATAYRHGSPRLERQLRWTPLS